MQVLVEYQVRREELAEHLRLVAAVYADLERLAPAGLGYATFQLEDETGFVELLTGQAGPGPLAASAAFARFRAGLDARCERPPVLTELRQVASYPAAAPHSTHGQEHP